MGNNLFKYIFAFVVFVIVVYIMYLFLSHRTDISVNEVDQTSTVTTIQTDLRFAIAALDTFNPLISNNRNVQELSKIIYEPLITLNQNYKIEPCLAESITKVDDLCYEVKLRQNVKFSDSTPFTANDVQFTIDMLKSNTFYSVYQDNIKAVSGVEVVDDYTLKIFLSEPVLFFEYNLTFPILCKAYYEGEDFINTPKVAIGTGMFRVSDYSSNVIKLAVNDNYWNLSQRKPMVSEISINLYSNMGEVYSAFKNGEIDILNVKINNVEQYIGNLGYNKIEFKSRDYDYMAINTQNPVLSQNVRKAIGLAIDRNNIVATCLGSGYTPSNFSLDMGDWLYTRDLNVEPNLEVAQQLLIDDGWTYSSNRWQKRIDGRTHILEFSITVNNNDEARMHVAETIKAQLERIGIRTDVRVLSADSYNRALNDRNYDIALVGIRLGYSPNLNTFFGNGNLANYYNEEVMDLLNKINNTQDESELHNYYERIFEIYLEEVPYIGLYRNTETVVYNQNLVCSLTANSYNIYHNIEKWYRQ